MAGQETVFLHLFCADPAYLDDYYNDFKAPALAPGMLNQEYHDGPATLTRPFRKFFLTGPSFIKDKEKRTRKASGHTC